MSPEPTWRKWIRIILSVALWLGIPYLLARAFTTMPDHTPKGLPADWSPDCEQWELDWNTVEPMAIKNTHVYTSLIAINDSGKSVTVGHRVWSLGTQFGYTEFFLEQVDTTTGEVRKTAGPFIGQVQAEVHMNAPDHAPYFVDGLQVTRIDPDTLEVASKITVDFAYLRGGIPQAKDTLQQVEWLPDGTYGAWVNFDPPIQGWGTTWIRFGADGQLIGEPITDTGFGEPWIMRLPDRQVVFVNLPPADYNVSDLSWERRPGSARFIDPATGSTSNQAPQLELVDHLFKAPTHLSIAPSGWKAVPNTIESWYDLGRPAIVLDCSVPQGLLPDPDAAESWWATQREKVRIWRRQIWIDRYGEEEYMSLRRESVHIDGVVLRGIPPYKDRLLSEALRQSIARDAFLDHNTWDVGELDAQNNDHPKGQEGCKYLAVEPTLVTFRLPDNRHLIVQAISQPPKALGCAGYPMRIGFLAADATDPLWLGWMVMPAKSSPYQFTQSLRIERKRDRLLLSGGGFAMNAGMPDEDPLITPLYWATIPLPPELADLPEGPLQ